jgi:hypothetical protein
LHTTIFNLDYSLQFAQSRSSFAGSGGAGGGSLLLFNQDHDGDRGGCIIIRSELGG